MQLTFVLVTNLSKSPLGTFLSPCVYQTEPAVLGRRVSVCHSGCCWWSTSASLQPPPGPGTCQLETLCWLQYLHEVEGWWWSKYSSTSLSGWNTSLKQSEQCRRFNLALEMMRSKNRKNSMDVTSHATMWEQINIDNGRALLSQQGRFRWHPGG